MVKAAEEGAAMEIADLRRSQDWENLCCSRWPELRAVLRRARSSLEAADRKAADRAHYELLEWTSAVQEAELFVDCTTQLPVGRGADDDAANSVSWQLWLHCAEHSPSSWLHCPADVWSAMLLATFQHLRQPQFLEACARVAPDARWLRGWLKAARPREQLLLHALRSGLLLDTLQRCAFGLRTPLPIASVDAAAPTGAAGLACQPPSPPHSSVHRAREVRLFAVAAAGHFLRCAELPQMLARHASAGAIVDDAPRGLALESLVAHCSADLATNKLLFSDRTHVSSPSVGEIVGTPLRELLEGMLKVRRQTRCAPPHNDLYNCS